MEKKSLMNDIKEVLVSKEDIEKRVSDLARAIESDYENKDLLCVGILNGAVCFYVDLIKELDMYLEMNFMRVSSYGRGTESLGYLKYKYDLEVPVEGRNVLIVEDIIDSGFTLSKLKEYFAGKSAASVKICTALDKPERRKVKDLRVDYVGFSIPDEFVIGYGLDYDDNFRNTYDVRIYKP